MPKLKILPHEIICPEGAEIDAETGESILNAALANDIHIEHACEKSCACTTCHVIVREGFYSLEEAEEKMYDYGESIESPDRIDVVVDDWVDAKDWDIVKEKLAWRKMVDTVVESPNGDLAQRILDKNAYS